MKNEAEGRSKLVEKHFPIPLVIYLSLNLFKPSFQALSQTLIILVLVFILLSQNCIILSERKPL